jgi:hypothetical protein
MNDRANLMARKTISISATKHFQGAALPLTAKGEVESRIAESSEWLT